MNSHDDIRKQLSAYAGGDLEAAQRVRLEQHLAGCESCRAELADLRTVLHLLGATPVVEPPPWLSTRIMARIRHRQREKRSWMERIFFPLHVKLPLEAAALVLICVSGYYMARTLETDLNQPAIRGEAPRPAPAPASPEPMTKEVPSADTLLPAQPSAPTATDRSAPRGVPPEAPGPSSPQPLFVPAPPAAKEERAAPAAAPRDETALPLPGTQHLESAEHARPPAGEAKKKAYRPAPSGNSASEGDRAAPAGASGTTLPRVTVRLMLANPAAAAASLRETVIRTGGTDIDDGPGGQSSLRARLPAQRMGELLERLGRLGTVVERPLTRDDAGFIELNIIW